MLVGRKPVGDHTIDLYILYTHIKYTHTHTVRDYYIITESLCYKHVCIFKHKQCLLFRGGLMKATMELNYSHCSVQHFSMENKYVYVIRHPDVDE